MAVDNVALFLLLVPTYGFFWLHTFDPNLKTFVQVEGAEDEAPDMTFDATPSFFQPVALGWTVALGLLVNFNDGNCNLHVTEWNSLSALLAVVTVAVAGKIVFGPTAGSFKTVHLSPIKGTTRPLRLRILDYIRAYPMNLIGAMSLKFVLFAIFWVVVWIFGTVGLSEGTTTLILPLYIVLAWALATLRRISTVLVSVDRIQWQVETFLVGKEDLYRKIPGGGKLIDNMLRRIQWTAGQKLLFFASMLVGLFSTYVLLEDALRFCGAVPNGGLPSMRTVLSGLALLPILEGGAVFVFGAVAGIFFHGHS